MAVDVGTVGIWTSSRQWSRDTSGPLTGSAAAAAAELDDLGYTALWLGNSAADLELPAALLGATRRLAVATGIVNVWTEPVETVAASHVALAKAHPGRFLLGIGAGHAPIVGERYHRPYQALVDYLDALDAASPPVPPDERALAALGPRVLALAGARTAGAHPYLVTAEHTRHAREILGPGPLLAPELKVVVEADPTRARTIARSRLGMYLALPNYTNNLLRFGFTTEDFADGGSDRLVDAVVAWGDLDTVAARISEHFSAGANHVCLQVLTDAPTELPRAEYRALAPVVTKLGG